MALNETPRGPARRRGTELDRAIAACWRGAWILAVFSCATNILALAAPLYMLQVYDRVISTGHVETLVMLTAMAGAAMLLIGVLDAVRGSIMVRMSCWLTERLGPVLLASSVRARLYGDNAGAQPLRDLAQVQGFISSPSLTVFFDAPWTPVFLALLWVLHPWLGILAVSSGVLLFLIGAANELLTRGPTKAANTAQMSALQQAEVAIRNAEVVRAMGMMPALVERWRSLNRANLAAVQHGIERSATLVGSIKFVRMFVQSGTLGLGAYLVLQGEVSGGAMLASSVLLGRALAPVEQALGTWRNFGNARLAYERLKARLQAVPPEPPRTRLPAPRGLVTFDRVTYAPPGGRAPVLQSVSFQAKPGESIAVIGPSASGKSTLCRLLVGIAEPSSGEVRLDGSELRHWNAEDLGRHIGYLPQDVELFSGTVRENIARMGEVVDEDVVEAAMRAHAHEMIQRLPQGYETSIGDGGARLSGGQRQRLGLARAVYRNPRLIVLDEPNANLDQAGEAALAAAISDMKEQGATLLIVGHRPSTIAQADKILLLKDGRVELFGPRDEVMKRFRVAASKRDTPAQAEEAQSA